MKKAKKGFTIVELVVVIAVIAILAAVLIPTFISIVNRAKVSNDNQLVRNLNTALITEEADGNKAENMSQAIEIAEDYGYKLENLQAKADGYVLLWNQTTNRFYVESAEGTITSNPEVTDFPVENYTYWEISKTLGTNHSTYLTEGSGNIAATNLGVDVSGISSAVNVTYTGNENKVIIATNGGDLSVNAENGHVAHYGFVKNLTVTAVNGADCYCEHGYVGTLAPFGTGKFVAEKGSQFHQTKIEVEGKVITPNTFVDLGATYGVHKRNENGICVICNDGGTPSAKNGLVDGYYYKDDVLYTGTETDNGITYTFENGRLVVEASKSRNETTRIWELTYEITNDDKYVTKELFLDTSDLNLSVGMASSSPLGGSRRRIKVNGDISLRLKDIEVTYSHDFKGAIDYLAQNVGKKDKSELLDTLENVYGFDNSYYPTMTKSDDFNKYLGELKTRGIISSTSVSQDNYEIIQNTEYTYGTFLKEKYSIENILALPWLAKVKYYDSFHGGFPNGNKENGIFAGETIDISQEECFFNDPEMILLFFKHTYDNIMFTGVSQEQVKVSNFMNDMTTENSTVYSFVEADWMSQVCTAYNINIQSLYYMANGKMDIVDIDRENIDFYMFTAPHGCYMTNMYQSRSFVAPTFKIIIENTSYGA